MHDKLRLQRRDVTIGRLGSSRLLESRLKLDLFVAYIEHVVRIRDDDELKRGRR